MQYLRWKRKMRFATVIGIGALMGLRVAFLNGDFIVLIISILLLRYSIKRTWELPNDT